MGLEAAPFAISAAASAAQGISQASAFEAKAGYDESIAGINARFAELKAEDALRRGGKEAGVVRGRARQALGRQRAALAAQGISLSEGTPLEALEDTRAIAEQDILTVQNNAWREAWGFRAEAQESRARGAFAGIAGRAQAGSTLLTGGLRAVEDIARGATAYQSKSKRKTT